MKRERGAQTGRPRVAARERERERERELICIPKGLRWWEEGGAGVGSANQKSWKENSNKKKRRKHKRPPAAAHRSSKNKSESDNKKKKRREKKNLCCHRPVDPPWRHRPSVTSRIKPLPLCCSRRWRHSRGLAFEWESRSRWTAREREWTRKKGKTIERVALGGCTTRKWLSVLIKPVKSSKQQKKKQTIKPDDCTNESVSQNQENPRLQPGKLWFSLLLT